MRDREKTSSVQERVVSRMDEILGRHLERLIGTRVGMGSLPLNSLTIATLVLLAENGRRPESTPGSTSPGQSALRAELSQMGFLPGGDFSDTLHRMEAAGYVRGTSLDSLSAGESSLKMSRLLNHLFPGMPGLQLVAYIAQTIQEVVSGRKDTEAALDQFSQVLSMQGRRVVARQGPLRPPRLPHDASEEVLATESAERVKPSRDEAAPRVIGSGQGLGPRRPVEVKAWDGLEGDAAGSPSAVEPGTEEEMRKTVAPKMGSASPGLEDEETGPGADPAPDPSEETVSVAEADSMGREEVLPECTVPAAHLEHRPPAELWRRLPSGDPDLDESGGPESGADEEAIEHRVRSYEGDLAAVCPHCGRGKIQTRKTSTDRIYYVCSEKGCPFVSWGRPYHLLCPRCKNPFLIEVQDGGGAIYLKCPRATCGYRRVHPEQVAAGAVSQEPPGGVPLRRVRRRVVRRKR